MRVLLIQPPTMSRIGLQAFIMVEPLGLEIVASSLLAENKVQMLDARLDPDIRSKLASFKPEAVGVAASFTCNVYGAYSVLDAVKDYSPGIRTFVGGYHASMCYSEFQGRADAVVCGEGEVTAAELLRCWDNGKALDEVAGIAFQGGEGWKVTGPRPLIENLDQVPLPARHLVAKYQEHYFMGGWRPCASVETSRGCNHRCKFCAVWQFNRGRYREQDAETVVQQLQEVTAPYVSFADDNFFASPSRAQHICGAIKQAGIKKLYMMQLRSDAVVGYPELIKEWVEVGLRTAFIGFESFKQDGLDSLNKHTSVQTNEEAIRILRELHVGVMSSFIVDPDYSAEDFAGLKHYIRRTDTPLPMFFVLSPIPGTLLHRERRGELISNDYNLYDGHHAVLPSRLGLKCFYREYVKLYTDIYLSRILPFAVARRMAGGSPLKYVKQALRALWLRKKFNPRSLLRHHQRASDWPGRNEAVTEG
ncbi:B12-binding domain-containing radical SAM protein [Chloroflexota bacterium]